MTFFLPPKHNFHGFTLVLTVVFFCFSGYAADNPGERFFNALTCFSNKFIYSSYNEAYRLNESGNLNVPPDALDLFCHGPCLDETQRVLKCVDSMISTFTFNNKATVPEIRDILHDGCSYTSQRDDTKLPTSPKRGWKHLLRLFKNFKNSDDYHNYYYQYHIHFDDYKKQQRRGMRSRVTKSSPVEATSVHEQVVAAAARAFTLPRERARVHNCSEDGHRNQKASGDGGEHGEGVDADCEKFIEWFRETLKLERQISAEKEFQAMLDRSA